MTDLEWDHSTDPLAMIRFVAEFERPVWVARKLRLYAAACCRAVWTHMPDWRSREAVEEAERVVSGAVRRSRLLALRDNADDAWSTLPWGYRYWYDPPPRAAREPRPELPPDAIAAARAAAACADPGAVGRAAAEVSEALVSLLGAPARCDLLREVCGNPYRRPPGRRWWSTDVRDLARSIEAERGFARMPILGDALLDAGLDHDGVVRHCQGPGPHAVGCWVLDLALSRD